MTDPTTIVRQGLERVELEPLTLITFHARRERRRRNQRLAAGAVGGLIVLGDDDPHGSSPIRRPDRRRRPTEPGHRSAPVEFRSGSTGTR